MKLIGSHTSPFVRKVRAVLAEKKIEYDFVIDSPWLPATAVPGINPLGKIPVLVIDEWLLGAKKQGSAQLLLELLGARFAETTTIFCSQINPEGWPMAVDVQALGESILGRAASNSFRINLKGEDLRQVYATKP